jgi:hypothetical protein
MMTSSHLYGKQDARSNQVPMPAEAYRLAVVPAVINFRADELTSDLQG